MAGSAIAAAAAYFGAGGTVAAVSWSAVAYAAFAAAATYTSQAMAKRQAQAAERKSSTPGATLASFRASDAARQIIYGKCRTGGPLTYVGVTQSNQWLLMDVALAGHECAGFEEVWLDEYQVILAQNVVQYLGTKTRIVWDDEIGQATTVVDDPGVPVYAYHEASGGRYNVRDGFRLFWCELNNLGAPTQTSSPFLQVFSPGGQWTSDHRLQGICHVPLMFLWAPDAFPSGPPNPTFVVLGKRLYDPRLDGSIAGGSGAHRTNDSSTWTYSNNAALCLLDYLLDSRLGVGAAVAEIDMASFQTAATECDVLVTKGDGTTEARYTTNGLLYTDATHETNLGTLLSSMDGKLVYSGGKFRLYAGVWTASVTTFTEDDLRGPITIQTQQERSKIVNSVRGTFASPDNNWQPSDYPPVTSSTYRTLDQGDYLWADLPQPMVTSVTQAQRLAKIAIERSRRQIVVQAPMKLTAMNVVPGDTIALTFTRYGWTTKTFTVDELRVAQEDDENGQPMWGVDLILREHDSGIFSWTTTEEARLPQPPTTYLPDPFATAPPNSISVTEELREIRSVVTPVAVLTFGAPQDAFAARFRPRYKLVTDSEWRTLADTASDKAEIAGIEPGTYIFAVASVNYAGTLSAFIERQVSITGLTGAPSALTNLTAQLAGGLAVLTWDQSTDLDVRVGGRIEFRHSPATTGATWATATPIGNSAPGSSASWILPAKSGTYLVRPYDSSGVAGAAASFVTDGATVLNLTTLSTSTQHTAFTGTKTSTVVASSKLKLDSLGNWDSVASVDAIVDVDGLGGIASSGSYDFSATMDLGSTKRVRVLGHLLASVVNVSSSFDARSGDIDTWPTFDGGDGDEAEAWVEFRDSPDNATWSTWRRCDASEAQNRYFQFRAQLRSYDADYNIEISELSATAAEIV